MLVAPHMDPAVVAAQPMTLPNMSQTPPGGDYSASSLLTSGTDRTTRPQSQTTAQTETTSQQQQLESTYSTGRVLGHKISVAKYLSHVNNININNFKLPVATDAGYHRAKLISLP